MLELKPLIESIDFNQIKHIQLRFHLLPKVIENHELVVNKKKNQNQVALWIN